MDELNCSALAVGSARPGSSARTPREWEQSFIAHLKIQQDILAEADKGVMTEDLDRNLKQLVVDHVTSFVPN